MSSLISKLYVVSSLCFAIIAFSVRSQLAGSLQMLLLVIQSAFRPSKSNKHHVLFDRMFSTFLCCLRFFPAQVSSFIGHKFYPYQWQSEPLGISPQSHFKTSSDLFSCFPFRCLLGCSVLVQILTI